MLVGRKKEKEREDDEKKNQKAAGVYVDVGNVRKHDRS